MVCEESEIVLAKQRAVHLKNCVKNLFEVSFNLAQQEHTLKMKRFDLNERAARALFMVSVSNNGYLPLSNVYENLSIDEMALNTADIEFCRQIKQQSLYCSFVAYHIYKTQYRGPNVANGEEYKDRLKLQITRRLLNLLVDNANVLHDYNKIDNFQQAEIYLKANPNIVNNSLLDFSTVLVFILYMEREFQLMHNAAFQCVTLRAILNDINTLKISARESIENFFIKVVNDKDYRRNFLLQLDMLVLSVKSVEKLYRN
ncbi:uncharacterized protein LOC119690231 [Teleopsis dalmanni]|uniref:uncharacterized protein LOC119663547 n=1 Tax=Teleopsis dalmanni TaxID=139649 RepID=UPI0018CF5C9E|nr:uncharacterized protein LOC119663547 [Teleopsis dalmanni]XP_037929089.1 uncharacterized protein LOC119663549 [Teleopsis dalmanni]XP_037959473.1 uncharacterized protein LOC119688881 [Teleopsis dalmanni]XP_037959474.1 uncharacterized protein LOC119688883 [Teleopsis dalmanni]XP_037959475.1 uncharacterized protein LOC119688884 [Teleopsis dalmanni]XP_037961176.1 uncharacterized protein LOC119690231 [Teleopsis dalmanni]